MNPRQQAVSASLRKRYTDKWRDPNYRLRSPAYDAREQILEALNSLGDVQGVLDVGCGTGRIHPFLAENGYWIEAVDTCDNCLETEVAVFHRLDIGDMDKWVGGPFDLNQFPAVLCSDVMEHLPDEMIDLSLRQMEYVSRLGAVFGISLLPDIGKLHCSVHPADWWEAKLKAHWPIVERREVPQLHPRQGPDSWGLWLCRKEAAE